MNNTADIIVAGGKTGGHLFPGIAVATALQRHQKKISVLFVGTGTPFEVQTLNAYGFPHRTILSQPIKSGGLSAKIWSIMVLFVSLAQSLMLIRQAKPGFVLGVGGFSSFAVVLAAWFWNVPTAIQEQNAFPGLTNRILARFADTIFTAFEHTRRFETNPKTCWVGNPVRKEAAPHFSQPTVLKGFDPQKLTLLITGGSQGAKSINTTVIQALELMNNPADRFNIIHQTGKSDEENIRVAYERLAIPATVQAFFTDLPNLQERSDLVISRAGAGTVFELCAKGRPAILIPYPYAADDHQHFNARALAEQGAAVLLSEQDLSAAALKQTIEALENDPGQREQMRRNLKKIALADADEKIAGHILKILGQKG